MEVQHGHAVVVEGAPGKGPRAVVVGPFLLSLRVAIEALLLAVPLERFQLVFALLVTLAIDDGRLGNVERGTKGGGGCDLPLGRLCDVVCLRVCVRLKEGRMLLLL